MELTDKIAQLIKLRKYPKKIICPPYITSCINNCDVCWANEIIKLIKELCYLSPDEVKEAIQQTRKEKDTQWHDNIQVVKRKIREGANPEIEKNDSLAYDHWHPEFALLWEIAIEAQSLKSGEEA